MLYDEVNIQTFFFFFTIIGLSNHYCDKNTEYNMNGGLSYFRVERNSRT